jgi:orotidine-5'-phosphate decarboxylase
MVFIDRLIERVIETKSPSVVGLDTRYDFVPQSVADACAAEFGDGARAKAEAIYRFNIKLIDGIKDIVPAVKPQIAFYEIYGQYGAEAFIKTSKYARDNGLIVIADVKRGDVGPTAEAYADAFLGPDAVRRTDSGQANNTARDNAPGWRYDADAITVNPYLGYDGVEPFITNCRKHNKGVFILVKTSNPSSRDFQDLELANGKKVYEHIGEKVREWATGDGLLGAYGYSSVCAVVGATYPEQAGALREQLKRVYFLVPGYGAQGGGANDAAAAFDGSGLGALVNASRSVLCAWSDARWEGKYSHEDFAEAARAEVLRMKSEINKAINASG